MRFIRVLHERFSADIYKIVRTPNHTFEILVKNSEVCSLGNARRPFIFKVNGHNRTRYLFYTNTPYMEVNLEKWQVSSKDDSFIFIPEFGRLSLIRSVDSKRLLLPDQELKGYFMANIFYSDYLLIIYSQSVMVINTKSMESSSYTFDFALNNAQMASENTIVLEKEDGDNVTFDRSSLMFV